MKELPILFNGEMVRAILEGRKTVTRRPVKGGQIPTEDTQAAEGRHRWSAIGQRDPRYGFCVFGATEADCAQELAAFGRSPFGKTGDRLWVRETHKIATGNVGDYQASVRYMADGEYLAKVMPDPEKVGPRTFDRTMPSIHMPRWASRILLEITAIRVERLHQMKTADYQAEGCHGGHGSIPGYIGNATPSEHFHHVWNSTGGDWKANPWVWVVEFRRIEDDQSSATQAA